ncbi:hypothetical protein VTJ83DRAFT_2529 [Remersonia thermophila]|uniref:Uncharacterized protein n=1 Tax=Remersonia thermophila TaxID=72144 RepID=A0ABR4DJL7_9PEZI
MADFAYRPPAPPTNDRWLASRSPLFENRLYSSRFDTGSTPSLPQSVLLSQGAGAASTLNLPGTYTPGPIGPPRRTPAERSFTPVPSCTPALTAQAQSSYPAHASSQNSFRSAAGIWGWEPPSAFPPPPPPPPPSQQSIPRGTPGPYQSSRGGRYSPSDSVDDLASPSLSDYSLDNAMPGPGPVAPPRPSSKNSSSRLNGAAGSGGGAERNRTRGQRRPSNRDEFDGPHQFLKPPPPEYIALQERELPRMPTHLLVQEQDSVLNQVNDRLSQCAYDFIAKYQFPIPLTHDARPVERPQDREWAEWVYLLKRLATKRRIPARVLYDGQIKQFVTVLENSLEMRHSAAKNGGRPLKDDRNILQQISAGIQVAKILKDAQAMDYLDRLYVSTEKRIQERVAAAAAAAAQAAPSNMMRFC